MNILYQTYGKVQATKGGTERTTITVASALTRLYGAHCFSIYEEPSDAPKEDCFVKEFRWTPRKELDKNAEVLRRIILENSIDVVIVQGAFIHVPRFRAAVRGTTCKVIFAHHFEPIWELTYSSFTHLIKHRPKSLIGLFRWGKNIITYPLTAAHNERQLAEAYRAAYESADHVVLLCQSFIKQYSEFAGLQDISKFVIIPNGLSFDFTPRCDELVKRKKVLIVSRLDEPPKRLSLALRIWTRIRRDSVSDGWILHIVGHGTDRKLYEHIITSERIPDVTLEGRQNPIPYYKEASIFMMTSRSESWGLTLTEAQQMGVVPVAFDTYASLREIITDGEDGVVIEEGDVDGYVSCMLKLMQDEAKRQRMAKQAIVSSQRFSQERIAGMWWKLLSEMTTKK